MLTIQTFLKIEHAIFVFGHHFHHSNIVKKKKKTEKKTVESIGLFRDSEFLGLTFSLFEILSDSNEAVPKYNWLNHFADQSQMRPDTPPDRPSSKKLWGN